MNILLVQPFQYIKTKGLPSYYLGVCYLAAFLKKYNIQTDIIDFNLENNTQLNTWKNIIKNLKKYDLLGISISSCPDSSSFINILSVISKVKDFYPNIKIALGGIYLEDKIEFLLNNRNIDFLYLGEANMSTIKNLLKSTFSNTPILIKDKVESDLDQYPFPIRPTDKNLLHIPIMSSRGCPNNCFFCTISFKWRGRSINNLLTEIELILKNTNFSDTPYFIFVDQNMCGNNKERLTYFCKNLISNNMKIEWAVSIPVNCNINKNDVKLFKKAGLKNVFIGIESASKSTLNRYNKNFVFELYKNFISNFRNYNIGISIGYIGADYWSNIKELKESLEFFLLNEKFDDFLSLMTEKLYPFKNCILGKKFLKETRLDKYYDLLWRNDYKFFIKDIRTELAFRIINQILSDFNIFSLSINKKEKREFFKYFITQLINIVECIEKENLECVNELYYSIYSKINKIREYKNEL